MLMIIYSYSAQSITLVVLGQTRTLNPRRGNAHQAVHLVHHLRRRADRPLRQVALRPAGHVLVPDRCSWDDLHQQLHRPGRPRPVRAVVAGSDRRHADVGREGPPLEPGDLAVLVGPVPRRGPARQPANADGSGLVGAVVLRAFTEALNTYTASIFMKYVVN